MRVLILSTLLFCLIYSCTTISQEETDTESDEFDAFLDKFSIDENNFKRIENRAFKQRGIKFPVMLKCQKWDKRIIHGCLKPRFFEPSARIYFDSGTDSETEVDIFNNGNLNATLEFVSIHLPWRFGMSAAYDDWSWGPAIGVGITAPAENSEDGVSDVSDAPVVLLSFGALLEYAISNNGARLAVEFGVATGFTSDESFGDKSDSSKYFGLKISIPTS